ncbi:MAG: spermidine synthase [Burkholderiaceae bacterium]|nr:MAG: spermidine synthase [Burkholderiaceae bacterium]
MSRRTSATPVAASAFPPLSFSEQGRVRYLHFGSPWVQGAMHLNRPHAIVLEYVQQMMGWLLFLETPQRMVQLGLGAAALTKFCYRQFSAAEIVAVELNPAVITAARSMFCLPPDDARLSVVEADAQYFISRPHHRDWATVLQVDLYDEHARGPVFDSVAFYRSCRAALQAPGILAVNLFSNSLFGDPDNLPHSLEHLRAAFDGRVLAFAPVHEGNVVALAFNGPPLSVDWETLYRRALLLEQAYDWPVRKWLSGMKQVNNLHGLSLEI